MNSENKLHKICLIYGNQQLLVDETTDSIIEDLLEGRQHEWALERFNAHELLKNTGESGKQNVEDLLISCETLPMLTDRKVIRIDNFELVKKSRNNIEKNNQHLLYETVEKIIKNPPESIWFVFTSTAMREQDFSNPLFHSIKQTGLIKKFIAHETPFDSLPPVLQKNASVSAAMTMPRANAGCKISGAVGRGAETLSWRSRSSAITSPSAVATRSTSLAGTSRV